MFWLSFQVEDCYQIILILTHEVPVLPSYRNQSIDLQSKSFDRFLYEGNNGTSWVKVVSTCFCFKKSFFENQKRSGTSFSALLSVWFLKKNVFHAIFYFLTKFLDWLSLLIKMLGNICIVTCCCSSVVYFFPVYDVINFEIELSFLIKSFSCIYCKSQDLILIS